MRFTEDSLSVELDTQYLPSASRTSLAALYRLALVGIKSGPDFCFRFML